MDVEIPEILLEAIRSGRWRDPGSKVLNAILGAQLELPDMMLFEDVSTMRSVGRQVVEGGLVEDPAFCLVSRSAAIAKADDPRLNVEAAVFVAGSVVPGDDVLVLADLGRDRRQPHVFVLDWRRQVPNRWVLIGTLAEFIDRISEGLIPRE